MIPLNQKARNKYDLYYRLELLGLNRELVCHLNFVCEKRVIFKTNITHNDF